MCILTNAAFIPFWYFIFSIAARSSDYSVTPFNLANKKRVRISLFSFSCFHLEVGNFGKPRNKSLFKDKVCKAFFFYFKKIRSMQWPWDALWVAVVREETLVPDQMSVAIQHITGKFKGTRVSSRDFLWVLLALSLPPKHKRAENVIIFFSAQRVFDGNHRVGKYSREKELKLREDLHRWEQYCVFRHNILHSTKSPHPCFC